MVVQHELIISTWKKRERMRERKEKGRIVMERNRSRRGSESIAFVAGLDSVFFCFLQNSWALRSPCFFFVFFFLALFHFIRSFSLGLPLPIVGVSAPYSCHSTSLSAKPRDMSQKYTNKEMEEEKGSAEEGEPTVADFCFIYLFPLKVKSVMKKKGKRKRSENLNSRGEGYR